MRDKRLNDYHNRLDARLQQSFSDGVFTFKVKEKLCIYEKKHRDYTLNLMRNISACVIGEYSYVKIDLSDCPEITASASVLLFAEVSRARIATENDNCVEIKLPTSKTLSKVLQETGWTKAINAGYKEQVELFEHDETFQTSSDPAKAIISILTMLRNNDVELKSLEGKVFSRGVNEAMLNVLHHAYSHEDYPLGGIGRRWWQSCFRYKDYLNNKLVYIICDFGQGILGSLPKKYDNETVIEHLNRAMQIGETCTGQLDRGKGSGDIVDAASIKDNSTLFIASNNAVYIKQGNNRAKIEESVVPLLGTVVEWQVDI